MAIAACATGACDGFCEWTVVQHCASRPCREPPLPRFYRCPWLRTWTASCYLMATAFISAPMLPSGRWSIWVEGGAPCGSFACCRVWCVIRSTTWSRNGGTDGSEAWSTAGCPSPVNAHAFFPDQGRERPSRLSSFMSFFAFSLKYLRKNQLPWSALRSSSSTTLL